VVRDVVARLEHEAPTRTTTQRTTGRAMRLITRSIYDIGARSARLSGAGRGKTWLDWKPTAEEVRAMTDEMTTPALSDQDIRTVGQASVEERPGPDTDTTDPDTDTTDSDSDDVDSDSDDTDSQDADSQDQ
jgi:hypothetical protein